MAWAKPYPEQIAKSLVRGEGFGQDDFQFHASLKPQLGLGENAYFAKSLGRDGGFCIWLFRALQSGLHPPVSGLLTRLDTRSADFAQKHVFLPACMRARACLCVDDGLERGQQWEGVGGGQTLPQQGV